MVTTLLDPDGAVRRPGGIDGHVELSPGCDTHVLSVKIHVGTVDVALDAVPAFITSNACSKGRDTGAGGGDGDSTLRDRQARRGVGEGRGIACSGHGEDFIVRRGVIRRDLPRHSRGSYQRSQEGHGDDGQKCRSL